MTYVFDWTLNLVQRKPSELPVDLPLSKFLLCM